MDEITYWIYTKRAPCLMGYDDRVINNTQIRLKPNLVKQLPKPVAVRSPEKKRKRKLSILDDVSETLEKKQNVYFEDSQQIKRTVLSSCKTASDSDIDFNIKNSLKLPKNLQRKNGKVINKKSKLITSTPKAKVGLRRSSRKLRISVDNNSPIKETLNIFNGNHSKEINDTIDDKQHCLEVVRNCNGEEAGLNIDMRPNNRVALHTHFEDMSDVSGFTANYIRSTKVLANKSRRNLKNKHRILAKGTKNNTPLAGKNNVADRTIESENPELLNNTDLSQVVNNTTVNNTTSHNETIGGRTTRTKGSNNRKKESTPKTNLNISFISITSGTSRYPIRNKRMKLNDSGDDNDLLGVSRTRSGRFVGQKCVANGSPVKRNNMKRKKRSSWVKTEDCVTKPVNKSEQSLKKDSVRSKSGFAECFSDSDEDQPLKQGKFFDV